MADSDETPAQDSRRATLYRMELPDHVCPFGLKARQMLLDSGFDLDERVLRTRQEVEAVKQEHGVATTPLIFVDGEPVGGSDDLETYLRAST